MTEVTSRVRRRRRKRVAMVTSQKHKKRTKSALFKDAVNTERYNHESQHHVYNNDLPRFNVLGFI